jgi:hypothetical protein
VAAELIRGYVPDDAGAWDDLVARSVNGTMLHTRRYLSYHGDRFRDRSLLVTNSRGWPIGAFPAAEHPAGESVVTSHPGLTYGGLVHDGSLHRASMMSALTGIAAHYRDLGFARLRYKALPQIYQVQPSADDVHALYRLGASRYSCDLAAAIGLSARGRVAASRRQRRRRAEAAGVRMDEGWQGRRCILAGARGQPGPPPWRDTDPLAGRDRVPARPVPQGDRPDHREDRR